VIFGALEQPAKKISRAKSPAVDRQVDCDLDRKTRFMGDSPILWRPEKGLGAAMILFQAGGVNAQKNFWAFVLDDPPDR